MARFVLSEDGWRWMNRSFEAPVSEAWGLLAVLASLEPFEEDGFTQVELRQRAAQDRRYFGADPRRFDEWWTFYTKNGLIVYHNRRSRQ